MNKWMVSMLNLLCFTSIYAQSADATYAEKLGFPRGAKVVILHVDDVGMSWDSNQGAINSIDSGVANSCSIMMTCPWVAGFAQYLQTHPRTDAGLHLTLTSEWQQYKWPPVSGATAVPGLVDSLGTLWPSVEQVVAHASPQEVEMEIRAQVDRALKMGIKPTHLDSHMGTLFASPEFIQRYMKVGIDYKIPIMFPAGHATLIQQQSNMPDVQIRAIRELGKKLWEAGLPLIDDLHNFSYGWEIGNKKSTKDIDLQNFKVEKYKEALKQLKPGLTMIIMHSTFTTEVFSQISDSGPTRRADMLAMMDPRLKKALQDEKIILTTWREIMERRRKIAY